MEDYVPQDDFVDDAIIERVKKADEKRETKKGETSKASRNLPKKTKKSSALLKKKTVTNQ